MAIQKTESSFNTKVTPAKLREILLKAFPAKLKVLVVGYPGCGKTEIIKQVSAEIKHNYWVSHPAIKDPTDYNGMPFSWVNEDHTREADFVPFGDIKKLINATTSTVACFDDIGQAPVSVQGALMQLLQERRCNNIAISDHVTFVGATNDPTMKAGVSGMIEPLKSRWDTILFLTVSNEDWLKHALKHNFNPAVIAYHEINPTAIHPYSLGTNQDRELYALSSRDFSNTPCPRNVESVSKLLNAGITDFASIAGACGKAYAVTFDEFLKLHADIPHPRDIIKDPLHVKLPKEKTKLIATTTSLAAYARGDNPEHVDAVQQFIMNRLDDVIGTRMLSLAFYNNEAFLSGGKLHAKIYERFSELFL